MNLLLLSENPSKAYVSEITQELQERGHNVYPPYDIYDKDSHIYTANTIRLDNKTFITKQAIVAAVKNERNAYYQRLLELKGKQKVDAVLFFNPKAKPQISEDSYLQILKVLENDIPVYLYRDNMPIQCIGLSLGKDQYAIQSIKQDLNQIKPLQKVKRK